MVAPRAWRELPRGVGVAAHGEEEWSPEVDGRAGEM